MTKYLLPLSDIHLEFELYDSNGGRKFPADYFSLPVRDTDKNTIVLLNGDIGVVNRKHTIFPFLEELCGRFYHVFYVPGNHEFYNGSLANVHDKILDGTKHLKNFNLMTNNTVEMCGYRFVGTTLWTNFNNRNPQDIMTAMFGLTDYKAIRTGTRSDPYMKALSPYDVLVQHDNAVAFLKDQLGRYQDNNVKTIVMTHHLPSYKSVHLKYDGDRFNSCYASDLDALVHEYRPKFWFHGHTHDSMDYMLFDTRVMCNPRGYWPGDLNENFEPEWLIQI